MSGVPRPDLAFAREAFVARGERRGRFGRGCLGLVRVIERLDAASPDREHGQRTITFPEYMSMAQA
jgi:hypothetical protein